MRENNGNSIKFKNLSFIFILLFMFFIILSSMDIFSNANAQQTMYETHHIEKNSYSRIPEGKYHLLSVILDGDKLEVQYTAELMGGNGTYMDVFVLNETNYQNLLANRSFTTLHKELMVNSSSFMVRIDEIPKAGDKLYFITDNSETFTKTPNNKIDDYIMVDIQLLGNQYYYILDSDDDGHVDNADAFPNDPTEWKDTDNDSVGDNSDPFPNDSAASVDTDGDHYPDEWNPGKNEDDSTTNLHLDKFPNDPAASVDSDGDEYPDEWNMYKNKDDSNSYLHLDAFPNDPAASIDLDSDNYPELWNEGKGKKDSNSNLHLDMFPNDPAASLDSDNDGYPDEWNPGMDQSDSVTELEIDELPNDPTDWLDFDGDNIGDTVDTDDDNDGHPDDEDDYPLDPKRWEKQYDYSILFIIMGTIITILFILIIYVIRKKDKEEF